MFCSEVFFRLLLFCLLSSLEVNTSLQQIHVIFRHGARTPSKDNMYPKDPYVNDTWYPMGLGALTSLGKVQEYNIGRTLRQEYNKFLGDIYTPEVLYARTTDYARTKMSILLVLAGLWPPVSTQQWNLLLPWQPIPYNYEPYETDKLLGFPISYCPALDDEYKKSISAEEVKIYLKEHEDLIKYINLNSGLNVSTTLDLLTLYFGLLAEKTSGKDLPTWTAKIYPEFLLSASKFEYKIQTSNIILVRATGGPLVKKIIEDVKKGINEKIFSPKLFLYSAHEYNLAYILSVLKIFQPHIPPYGSYIVFEIHRNKNQYELKILYQDYEKEKPNVIKIPGCSESEFCLFEKFIELTKDVIPEQDWC